MKPSEFLLKLPPYIFAELDRQKEQVFARGEYLIDLSVGDPDLSPAPMLVDKLKEILAHAEVHRYPDYAGSLDYRNAVARWLLKRHNTQVDPETETIALIGSKEGLAHLTTAVLNRDDVVLVPSPSFPIYAQSTILAGGVPYSLPLTHENHYLPDFDSIPKNILEKTKLLFLNYPHNPTSAIATRGCFEKAIELAHEHDFIICHDAAYIEIHSASEKPLSILSLPGSKDVAVEFHSFSKTFSVAGWRVAFGAGNKGILAALARVKHVVDSGVFTAIQNAMIYAMDNLDDYIEGISAVYANRKQIIARSLENMGFEMWPSKASFYIWARIPKNGGTSIEFCKILMEKALVAAMPGVGFGAEGEGFVRFSVTVPTERLQEAMERITKTVLRT